MPAAAPAACWRCALPGRLRPQSAPAPPHPAGRFAVSSDASDPRSGAGIPPFGSLSEATSSFRLRARGICRMSCFAELARSLRSGLVAFLRRRIVISLRCGSGRCHPVSRRCLYPCTVCLRSMCFSVWPNRVWLPWAEHLQDLGEGLSARIPSPRNRWLCRALPISERLFPASASERCVRAPREPPRRGVPPAFAQAVAGSLALPCVPLRRESACVPR